MENCRTSKNRFSAGVLKVVLLDRLLKGLKI
jgi:hypothetical protein